MNDHMDHKIMVLCDGTTVSERLYRNVRQQVIRKAEKLDSGEICILEYFVDRDFWDSLSGHNRRLAGKCMVDLVERKAVPYEIYRERSDKKLEYIVIK